MKRSVLMFVTLVLLSVFFVSSSDAKRPTPPIQLPNLVGIWGGNGQGAAVYNVLPDDGYWNYSFTIEITSQSGNLFRGVMTGTNHDTNNIPWSLKFSGYISDDLNINLTLI
jgi:hypothetical protein